METVAVVDENLMLVLIADSYLHLSRQNLKLIYYNLFIQKGACILENGKMLAWIELEGDEEKFIASFVGEGDAHSLDGTVLERAPAT